MNAPWIILLLLTCVVCRAEFYDFLNDESFRDVPVTPMPMQELQEINIGSDIRKVFGKFGRGREIKDAPLIGVIQPIENNKLAFFCFYKLQASAAENRKTFSNFDGSIQSIYVFVDLEHFFQGHFLKPDSLQGQSLADVLNAMHASQETPETE